MLYFLAPLPSTRRALRWEIFGICRPQLIGEVMAMTNQPAKCPSCGGGLETSGSGAADMPALPNPNWGEPGDWTPRNWAEENLRRHIELLDQISGQLDQLKMSVEAGSAGSQQVLAELEAWRDSLKPRHGLCIDAQCAPCRVHEEAIKEHVLLYVDWKVPGTVEKLEQARHRN